MKSHTSLVAQQPHLSEWADLFFASTFLDIVACPNWTKLQLGDKAVTNHRRHYLVVTVLINTSHLQIS